MKKKLEAIFFDLDDTLYPSTEFTKLARLNAVQAMVDLGIKVPTDKLFDELTEVVAEFSSNYNYHFDKLLSRFPEKVYSHINKSALITTAIIAYHDTKYKYLKPHNDALNFIKKIYKSDIVLGVITAGITVKQFEKLLRLDLYKYFSPKNIYVSEQIGISKPNIKLYQKACRNSGVNLEFTMYVGDNPVMDIDPCNQLGMVTVLMKKGGKHERLKGKSQASYTCIDFVELERVLGKDFIFNTPSS